MVADVDDILIHPRKGKKEKLLPECAILIPNPAESAVGTELFSKYGVEERFLYNSKLLVDNEKRLCVAGPCLGAPAAGLVLEKLIVLGVKSVCLFSCCGSIDQNLRIGDVILGVSGVIGEGVSAYYGGRRNVLPPGNETDLLRELLTGREVYLKECGLWSTDAPFRERWSDLECLKEQDGVSGVDMEFTALCSISSFRTINFGGLFVVSDELWGKEWKPGFTNQNYRKRAKSLLSDLIANKIGKVDTDEKNV